MTTWRPRLADLAAQVASLQAQSHAAWTCHIQDDGSPPETIAWLETLVRRDARFTFESNAANLGHYRNFERCLARTPRAATHIAYCDQDDLWHPGKLAAHAAQYASQDVVAVHSDYRLVDGEGNVVSASGFAFEGKSAPRPDPVAQVGGNMFTGCSVTFSRGLLPFLLPFPAAPTDARRGFHDWWTGLVAVSVGPVAFIRSPLLDYRQHDANAVGAKRSRFRFGNAVRILFLPRQRLRQGLQDRQVMAHAVLARAPPGLEPRAARTLGRLGSRRQAAALAWQAGGLGLRRNPSARLVAGLALLCLMAPRTPLP